MTTPTVPNSNNSPTGAASPLNALGEAATAGASFIGNLVRSVADQNVQLNPDNQPPVMKTLVYSPDVKVLIVTKNNVCYDVSADIVRGGLERVENAVSSFSVTLANKPASKYDNIFERMDRIEVQMKRTSWITVFTGYLDTIPYKQMYPGNVTISASCTLKKLMHIWWNPALPQSSAIFSQYSWLQAAEGDGQVVNDSGLGDLLAGLLNRVGGIPWAQIHVQAFPMQFLTYLTGTFEQNEQANQAQVQKFKTMLLGTDTSAGAGPSAGATYLATGSDVGGAGGSQSFGVGVQGYATAIIKACDDRRLGPVTADIQTSQALGTSGQTLEASNNQAVQTAGHDVGAISANQQVQERASDGAILGVACAMAETGGGVTIRNLYNNAVAGSAQCLPNDGPGTDGTSCGIFQQIDSGAYGTVAQRMDPYQSAGMFFRDLVAIGDWRNMDPATAIHTVQRNGTGTAPYSAALPTATTLVTTIRTAQGAYTPPATPGVIGASSVTGLASASVPGIGGGMVPGASVASGGLPGAPAVGVGIPNLQYDSEGAINCAMLQIGKPYVWGAKGPNSFDCSGLIHYCFNSIGLEVGGDTTAQAIQGTTIPVSNLQRGDVIQPESTHTVLYLGNGLIIEAYETGKPVHMVPINFNLANVYTIRRFCPNGGINPSAPFNPASGPGVYPASGGTQGAAGAGSTQQTEPIARNLFGYEFEPANFASDVAGQFTGEKCFMEDQPLIQMVQSVAKAGMRNFQSAPNGDFIAYYPDYFRNNGHPINMIIEDIEMIDVHIDYSDDNLSTHVYTAGDRSGQGLSTDTLGWLASSGVATVENASIYTRLAQAAPGQGEVLSGQELMRRYGVRPYMQEFAIASSPELEFLTACQLFAQKWAEQWKTTVKVTFMPELFPGMLIQLSTINLVVYVAKVTHNFDFEEGAGFTTDIEIMSPSTVNAAQGMEAVLPLVPAVNQVAQISLANLPNA